tara:strand:+ start:340 stop:537 length:198 start_codon:yes stop_codon:yes gene_type:complete
MVKISKEMSIGVLMSKREYPTEIEHSEWLRRQNYFLEEQNKNLKKELLESQEYIEILLKKLKEKE